MDSIAAQKGTKLIIGDRLGFQDDFELFFGRLVLSDAGSELHYVLN